jgi:hypothetical protein
VARRWGNSAQDTENKGVIENRGGTEVSGWGRRLLSGLCDELTNDDSRFYSESQQLTGEISFERVRFGSKRAVFYEGPGEFARDGKEKMPP